MDWMLPTSASHGHRLLVRRYCGPIVEHSLKGWPAYRKIRDSAQYLSPAYRERRPPNRLRGPPFGDPRRELRTSSSIEPLCGRTAPADFSCGQSAHKSDQAECKETDAQAEARTAVAFRDHVACGGQRGCLAGSESAPDIARRRLVGRRRCGLRRLAVAGCSSRLGGGCCRERSGRLRRSCGREDRHSAWGDYHAAASSRSGVRSGLGTGTAAIIPTTAGGRALTLTPDNGRTAERRYLGCSCAWRIALCGRLSRRGLGRLGLDDEPCRCRTTSRTRRADHVRTRLTRSHE
jgi:hypothetical protein